MISLVSMFGILVVIFTIIGGLRGWAKEIIATAGIVLALFALQQFGNALFPAEELGPGASLEERSSAFVVQVGFFLIIAFFAYQTPSAAEFWVARRDMESTHRFEWISMGLQQRILGTIIGFINGWLIIGSVWGYADRLDYPFGTYVVRPSDLGLVLGALPNADMSLIESTESLMNLLPLSVLGQNDIVLPLLVVILFLFVIIVMI